PPTDHRDRRAAEPEETREQQDDAAEDGHEPNEQEDHQTDDERDHQLSRPTRDAEDGRAEAQRGDREAHRERSEVERERDQAEPPAADVGTDDEQHDRQDRKTDQENDADPEAHERGPRERLAGAPRERRKEQHEEEAQDEQPDEAARPIDGDRGRPRLRRAGCGRRPCRRAAHHRAGCDRRFVRARVRERTVDGGMLGKAQGIALRPHVAAAVDRAVVAERVEIVVDRFGGPDDDVVALPDVGRGGRRREEQEEHGDEHERAKKSHRDEHASPAPGYSVETVWSVISVPGRTTRKFAAGSARSPSTRSAASAWSLSRSASAYAPRSSRSGARSSSRGGRMCTFAPFANRSRRPASSSPRSG